MPDKPTDSEIVKALEIFVNSVGKGFVFANVDIKKDGVNEFKHIDLSFDEIFDLIKRLQEKDKTRHKVFETKCEELEIAKAENERLKKHINLVSILYEEEQEQNKEIKAEAYKEFAEKLNRIEKFRSLVESDNYELSVTMREVDNLLKELVGEDNAKEKE